MTKVMNINIGDNIYVNLLIKEKYRIGDDYFMRLELYNKNSSKRSSFVCCLASVEDNILDENIEEEIGKRVLKAFNNGVNEGIRIGNEKKFPINK